MESGRKHVRSAAPALLVLFAVMAAGVPSSGRVRARFVGSDTCKKCHGTDAIGNQYRVWASSPHSGAWAILRGAKAKPVAEKAGVASPHTDVKCLKCHTTGGGRVEETQSEGVGCEACHGPASEYYEFSNHASFLDREGAYRKAVSRGMYPIRGVDGIKAREKLCRHCHRDEGRCFPVTPDEQKRRRLSLSVIADLPAGIKHPLHR